MKQIILLSLIFISLFASAQEITVSEFYLDETDLTAMNEATKVVDDNNEVCALIRVQTTENGFVFDGKSIGVAKVEQKVGEIWVYVPAGLRKIDIRHAHLGSLIGYIFPETLKPARTYIMKLVSGRSYTYIDQQVQSQYLVINVTPANGIVEINGQLYESEDGVATAFLPFGKYEYHVSAKNYHSETGHVFVNDPEKKMEISVSLKPAFGWIEISDDAILDGARVYIDDDLVGIIPCDKQPVSSGKHSIRVAKSKHTTWKNQINVKDGQTLRVTPFIEANFATVTLTTEEDAEIWWNDMKIGVGSCTRDFDYGDQKFETRKANHRNNNMVVTITQSSSNETINLPSPIPIYGSLNVETKPIGSNVYLDNELVGTTPLLLQKVLVGNHSLRVTHLGMRSDSRLIEINEGVSEVVKITMSKELNVLSDRPVITNGHCNISDEYDIIGKNVFSDCSNLRSITIPPTISVIEEAAFSGCYQLKSIVIPQSVKVIEPYTFYWCAALKVITIPEGITMIDNNAFSNCYGLESITLPSTINNIASNAFTDCKSLKHIYIPKGTMSVFKKILPSFLRRKLKEME